MILLLLIQLVGTYYKVDIDTLQKSNYDKVIIEGTILVLSLDDKKGLQFRIGDEHGHFVSCHIDNDKMPQPRLGVKLNIYGLVRKFNVNERTVIEIYVDRIEPVE